jgi:hypothetical protein
MEGIEVTTGLSDHGSGGKSCCNKSHPGKDEKLGQGMPGGWDLRKNLISVGYNEASVMLRQVKGVVDS